MRGNDRDGDTLSELLRAAGIDDTGVIVSEEYSTTTKVRILGARQQMMRLDFEERCNPDDKACKYILKWLDLIASAKSRQYCFVRLWKRYDYRTVGANHHKKRERV